jgi:hypothetical protein
MGEIAGLPYWEIAFDEKGRPNAADADTLVGGLPAQGVTDLMAFAHGWNNDRGRATTLYRRFFERVPGLLPGGAAPGLGFAGVIWPSKRWADETIPGAGGGAAGLADPGPAPSDQALVADLVDVFTAPEQRAALDQLGELLAIRPDDLAALQRFQALMAELSQDQDALWNGAKEALRQLTYFEMKKRAGVVGQSGLGPLVGRLAGAAPGLRVHLIGHSFGARLVSFTLAGLPDPGAGPSPVKAWATTAPRLWPPPCCRSAPSASPTSSSPGGSPTSTATR